MTWLLFYLFLALFVSFICSLVEAVLLTAPQSYLVSVRDKNKWANSLKVGNHNSLGSATV